MSQNKLCLLLAKAGTTLTKKMAHREDDEENGFNSNVRYNVDHCLVDHEAMFGMITNDSEQEKLMAEFRNYDNNPRDDIPGPISFMGRGNGLRFSTNTNNSNGNDGVPSSIHPTMNFATQQMMMNKKSRKQPTTTELQHWKEMRNLVEEKGQSKFLSSLKQIQENRTGTAKDKIPLLPVIIRQILHYDSHESAHVLVGEIGSDTEMEGTISGKAIERNPSILTVETVVLLKKIQLYCPRPAKFHLIISEKNTAKVWMNDPEEANHKLKVIVGASTSLSSSPSTGRVANEDMDSFGPNIDSMDSTPPSGECREGLNSRQGLTEACSTTTTANQTLPNKRVTTEKFIPPPQPFQRPPPPPQKSSSTTSASTPLNTLNTTTSTTIAATTSRFRPPPPLYETPETLKKATSDDTIPLPNEFEFSQPLLTTPTRSHHSNARLRSGNLSPELTVLTTSTSTTTTTTTSSKRKSHPTSSSSAQSSSSSSSNNDFSDNPRNKKRKQTNVPSLDPNHDLSLLNTPLHHHLQKDSFNDPLFDENSNQSTPMSYSPPLFQQQQEQRPSLSDQQVPPFYPARMSSLSTTTTTSTNTTSIGSETSRHLNKALDMGKHKKSQVDATLEEDDDDDPLKGILDEDVNDDEVLIQQQQQRRQQERSLTATTTLVPPKPPQQVVPPQPPPPVHTSHLAQPPKQRKTVVNFDDDDDPLKGILGDDEEVALEQSLFQEAPLHKPTAGKSQQKAKKMIVFDDDEDF